MTSPYFVLGNDNRVVVTRPGCRDSRCSFEGKSVVVAGYGMNAPPLWRPEENGIDGGAIRDMPRRTCR